MTNVDHILNAVEKLLIDGLPTNQAPTTEVTAAQRFEWRAYIIAMLDAGMPTDAASNACRWLVRNRFKSPGQWLGEQGRTFRRINGFRSDWPAPVVEIGGDG